MEAGGKDLLDGKSWSKIRDSFVRLLTVGIGLWTLKSTEVYTQGWATGSAYLEERERVL